MQPPGGRQQRGWPTATGPRICPMPDTQCPVLNAQCPMPNAQCPKPNAQMPNAAKPSRHEHASRPARRRSPQAVSAPAAAAERSRISPKRAPHWSCTHRAAEPTQRSSRGPHQKHIPATDCTCRHHRCAASHHRPPWEAGTLTAAGRRWTATRLSPCAARSPSRKLPLHVPQASPVI